MIKLGIIGTGNMAEALIAGLRKTPALARMTIIGFDVNRKRLRLIQKKYRVKAASNLSDLVRQSDVLLLSIKPQQMGEVLEEMKSELRPRHLILSIAAGIDTGWFVKQTGQKQRVIRLMPNTPALMRAGATAYYATPSCRAADKKIAHRLFSAVGTVVEVKKEVWLDAVTGLSGSGPAYLFAFGRALIKGGTAAGLPAQLTHNLVMQTLYGASLLLKNSREPIETLIKRVASKGGTTEAGLKVFQKRKFDDTVLRCVKAATRRAKELRKRKT